jgi:hypothetical protein
VIVGLPLKNEENSPPKEPDIERVEERKFSKDEYSKNPTTLRRKRSG